MFLEELGNKGQQGDGAVIGRRGRGAGCFRYWSNMRVFPGGGESASGDGEVKDY